MTYVQEAHLEDMEYEQVFGKSYSVLWDLESASVFSISQYYSPSASAFKYTDPASTELDWGKQAWLH